MPAKDIFHDTVKGALEKEGWAITHDHLPVAAGDIGMSIDTRCRKINCCGKRGVKNSC